MKAANYIMAAFSSLTANRFYSLLNILGLCVAMVCCIFIFLYVTDELGYDRFHANTDRIYRVAVERQFPNGTQLSAKTPRSLGPVLESDWPEVEHATRLSREHAERVLVRNDEAQFYEDGSRCALRG